MLQRVQSIWLFFASASLFCLFLFPYLQVFGIDGTSKIVKATGIYENINGQIVQTQPFLILTIATVIIALLPLLVIFCYKNRKKQIYYCYLVIVVILIYSFFLVQNAKETIGDGELKLENYSMGVVLPSAAILFIFLAIRGIRNDDKLIKSADRLR